MAAVRQGAVHEMVQETAGVRPPSGFGDGFLDQIIHFVILPRPGTGILQFPLHQLIESGPCPVQGHSLAADDRVRREMVKFPPQPFQFILPEQKGPLHGVVQALAKPVQIAEILPQVKDRKLRRRGGRRRPQIRDKIRDDDIGLMAHCRYDGCRAVKDCLGHLFLVKGPEILQGSAAPPYDDHIHSQGIQGPDPAHYAVRRGVPLHDRRIENDRDIGVSPL